MALIADGLMIAAALTATIYCLVLSARMRALTDLDRGLGAAIAQLSHQVDGMQGALGEAKRVSGASVRELRELTARAEMAAGRLELLLAALHDRDGARPLAESPAARRTGQGRAGLHEAPRHAPGPAEEPAPAPAAARPAASPAPAPARPAEAPARETARDDAAEPADLRAALRGLIGRGRR